MVLVAGCRGFILRICGVTIDRAFRLCKIK